MSRLIYADKLAREYERHPDRWYFGRDVLREIGEASDAIVRCDRCKHWDDSTDGRYVGGWCFCDKIQISTAPDWFCADGAKMDGDEHAAD